jgi:hypothetical protein
MMTFIPPRLRKPAVYALAGVLFAAAWLVRGGPLWWVSINAVILTAAVVARVYWLGGKDTDEGARAGSRADERQQLVSVRSRALRYPGVAGSSGAGAPALAGNHGGQRRRPAPGHPPRHRPPAGDLRYRPLQFSRVTFAPTGDRARPGRERPAAPPIRGVCAGQDEPGTAARASRSRTRPPSDDKITTSRA